MFRFSCPSLNLLRFSLVALAKPAVKPNFFPVAVEQKLAFQEVKLKDRTADAKMQLDKTLLHLNCLSAASAPSVKRLKSRAKKVHEQKMSTIRREMEKIRKQRKELMKKRN